MGERSMAIWGGLGLVVSFAQQARDSRGRRAAKRHDAAAIALLFALSCLLMFASARSGAAGEFNARGDTFSALREFAQARQIGTVETSSPAGDAAHGDLRAF